MRNAILYFMFPDLLERNLSNEHRRLIVTALKHKIPPESRPSKSKLTLYECDRAVAAIRQAYEKELGTKEIDFYVAPLYQQWWTGLRDEAKRELGSELKQVLSGYGLELHECGSKKKTLADCYPVNPGTGYWTTPTQVS